MDNCFFGNIVLPDRILYGGTVRCCDGVLTEILPGKNGDTSQLPYIFPGLVDIHNHGAAGHDYMEGTQQAFAAISAYLAAHGVTTAQCATVSAPVDTLLTFFAAFRKWKDQPGCRFTKLHIEGPYISTKNKGAHPENTLLIPERDGYRWILDNHDIIGEVTVAPELPGMPRMIRELCEVGIVVSGGHDDAEPEDIERAADAGMKHCTHIYCAMSTLHKTGIHRRCGLCEFAMSDNRITAEMIADNHHIPPQLASMIYRAKGAKHLCLVSDALAPTGIAEGVEFALGTGETSTKVIVEDGVAIVADRTCYAGSVQSLDQMIRNMVSDANIPLVDAVRMASLTPAEVIGIDHECGSIAVGKRADLCIVDASLNVVQTVVGGCTVYERESLVSPSKKGS